MEYTIFSIIDLFRNNRNTIMVDTMTRASTSTWTSKESRSVRDMPPSMAILE